MILTSTLSEESLPGLIAELARRRIATRPWPLLQFESLARALDPVLDDIASFGAIALTSPRAGYALGERLRTRARSGSLPDVWAAGPATAAAVRRFAAPRQSLAGSGALALAEAMVAAGVPGPVLYPCGSERRDELPRRLRGAGRVVHEVVCYAARLAPPDEIRAALTRADLVLIGSPRVMKAAALALAVEDRPGLICLGPATAVAARSHGWAPRSTAETPTVMGILAAIDDCIPATTIPE
jgi:uroporphyrinogen-III synthase